MALPADRASQHLAGVLGAEQVVAVVGVRRRPGCAVERLAGTGVAEQCARRHDRVEVVVDRRVPARAVRVAARALGEAEGLAVELPRARRAVGDVELHRSRAAAEGVEAVVGALHGRERRLLAMDRGDQPPRHAEAASGIAVQRQKPRPDGPRRAPRARDPVVGRAGTAGARSRRDAARHTRAASEPRSPTRASRGAAHARSRLQRAGTRPAARPRRRRRAGRASRRGPVRGHLRRA